VLTLLENLEIDAGLTYIDNEPLGRVRAIPLYHEHYCLLTASDAPLGDRGAVTWAEVGRIPLCLLTPDMQNRRIIDSRLREAGIEPQPTLQSNSMLVLFSHVRTGRWASVWPAVLAETLRLAPPIRSILMTEARPPPVVGLVYPQREPMAPATAALVTEARRFGQTVEPRR
jgi:DNA-binding transcriptional LysR family regulator